MRKADVQRSFGFGAKIHGHRHSNGPDGYVGESCEKEDGIEPENGCCQPCKGGTCQRSRSPNDEHGTVPPFVTEPAHAGIGNGLGDGERGGEVSRCDGIHVEAAEGVNDVEGKSHRCKLGNESCNEEPVEIETTGD